MVFKPGQSGNPSGRKPVDPSVKAMFDKQLPAALSAITSCLQSDDEAIRLKAANIIVERVLGKPYQAVELSGDDSLKNIVVNVITKTK